MRLLLYTVAVTIAWGQSEPSSLSECLARIEKLPRASYGNKPRIAAACLARWPLAATRGVDLLDLAKLYAEADRHDEARASIEKRLAEPGLTDAELGDALDVWITAAQRGSRSDEIRPRSIRAAEEVAPRLEKLGDGATWQKLIAYRWLNSYYRGDADDNGKVFHAATRFMELFAKLDAARQRDNEAQFGLYCAYENLAGVYSSRGDNTRAMSLLREGLDKLANPSFNKGLQKALLHYELVGKAAPSIAAPHWLNTPPAGGRVDFQGKVTIVEFTAHWCIPCQQTYPELAKLDRRYSGRGAQFLLATALYGYFGKDHGLSPESELATDRKYYVDEHKLTLPIAIAAKSSEDANSQAYGIQAIPELVVIDQKGVVRRFLMGLGPSEESALTALLEELLPPQLDADRPAAALAAVDPATLAPGQQGTLTVTLKLMEGGHANSNVPGDPNLVPTSFTPKPAAGLDWGRPSYPEPTAVREWYSPEPLSVFVDGAQIRVPFTVGAGAAAGAVGFNGVLTIQVCDHDQCYPAARVPVTGQLHVEGKTRP
jgi:thiol-disulfide isomerase/thioredoxin